MKSTPSRSIPWLRRCREAQRLVVGIEEHEERVVHDTLTPLVRARDRRAVEEHADRLSEAGRPILGLHLGSVGAEPGDVRGVGAERVAVEEVAAAEDGMGPPERDQPLREREQGAVFVLPVEPRDLVVLAVGVVVALLGAAALVAAQQHRDAL